MMNRLKSMKWIKILAAVAAAGAVAGCAKKEDAATKTANLAYVNWATGIAYTNLAKVILEEKMGYDVSITSADVGPAYTAVANGDMDAFMETWLPVLHADYVNKYRDKLLDLGHIYQGTRSGLVVPSYVSIDKISEINDHANRFDGEITGIDSGAGIMKTTENVIENYALKVKLVPSSEPAMLAALKDAIAKQEWIVITGWKPHWMFGRWDLKFLTQDEDKMLWKKGNIHIMGRLTLEEDKPELAQFLRNMSFTDEQLGDLMLTIEQSDEDVEDVVSQWMEDNEELIQQWIP